MHRTALAILLVSLLGPPLGCANRCDCPPEQSILGFSLVDGEFEGGAWQILVEVDGQSRTTCSSDSDNGPASAVVACDDPAVEVTQSASTLSVRLPEYQEDSEVSVQVTGDQGSVWTGSVTVQLRLYDTLDNCLCPFGEGIADLVLSDGG